MGKSSGYKGMLRDRVPKVVDFALKWCNAKERWINCAYGTLIKFVGQEQKGNQVLHTAVENKKIIAKRVLGLKKGKSKNFEFDKSIDWDNFTPEEKAYWKWVSEWVKWFTENFAYIENTYNISRSMGKDVFDCKVEIIQSYLSSELPNDNDDEATKAKKYAHVNKLTDYLVKCFERILFYKMISIFSTYLDSLVNTSFVNLTEQPKPSEIYEKLRIAYNQGAEFIEFTPRLILPISEDEDYIDILYEVCTNQDLRELIQWINKRITMFIGTTDYRTLGVRLRIATGMLNKLVTNNIVQRDIAEKIHYYLCNNVRNECNLVVNEDLPFLGCPSRLLLIATAHIDV